MSEQKVSKTKAKSSIKPEKSTPQGHHPVEHLVNIVLSDGSKIQVMTSWGKEGEVLHLDVDPKNHPAWQEDGKNFINASNERVSKFKEKFGDL